MFKMSLGSHSTINGQGCLNIVVNGQRCLNIVVNDQECLNIVVNGQGCLNIVVNGQKCLNIVVNGQKCLNIVFNGQECLKPCCRKVCDSELYPFWKAWHWYKLKVGLDKHFKAHNTRVKRSRTLKTTHFVEPYVVWVTIYCYRKGRH